MKMKIEDLEEIFKNNFTFSVAFTVITAMAMVFLLIVIAVSISFAIQNKRLLQNIRQGYSLKNDDLQETNNAGNINKQKMRYINYADSTLNSTLRLSDVLQTSIQIGISSKQGTRKYQQDSIVAMDYNTMCEFGFQKCIAVLCDGMGGMEGGELASSVSAKTLYEDYCRIKPKNITDFFRDEVHKVDDIVSNLKDKNNRVMESGSTLVCVVIENGMLYWLSVGDSRIYILRNQEMVQITTDHNYYNVLKNKVRQGLISTVEAETDPRREALTSYIGIGRDCEIGVNGKPFPLADGDMILLCSDGLYKTLSDVEIKEIAFCCAENAEAAAEELTCSAIAKNQINQDNTSVALIKYNKFSNI